MAPFNGDLAEVNINRSCVRNGENSERVVALDDGGLPIRPIDRDRVGSETQSAQCQLVGSRWHCNRDVTAGRQRVSFLDSRSHRAIPTRVGTHAITWIDVVRIGSRIDHKCVIIRGSGSLRARRTSGHHQREQRQEKHKERSGNSC